MMYLALTSSWSGGQVPAQAGKLTSVSDASLVYKPHPSHPSRLGPFMSGQPILLGAYYPNNHNNNNEILLQRLPGHTHLEPQHILQMTHAKKNTSAWQTDHATETSPTGSPVEADSHSLLPAMDDKANENMGEKETAEGTKGEDMQVVQHTSDTLNPVGMWGCRGKHLRDYCFK